MNYVGKSIRRLNDEKFVTGRQNYVDDIMFPSLRAAFKRSPYAHARIKSIDVTDALKMRGVVAVFTGKDVNSALKGGIVPWTTYIDTSEMKYKPRKMADELVKYVGEPVAVVVATDKYVAEDALDKIVVDYDTLPAAVTLEEALKDKALVHPDLGTNRAYSKAFGAGDPEGALKSSDKVIEVEASNERLSPSPMEPRGIVSRYEGGTLTVWSSTQIPHYLKSEYSRLFGIPSSRIRVIMPDVGGAFGSKAHIIPEELAVVYASMRLSTSVKWVASRTEEMIASTARQMRFRGKVGFNRDGVVNAIVGDLVLDMGAWLTLTGPLQAQIIPPMVPGPYRVRNLMINSTALYTNTPPMTMYRGASRPEATFIIERIMDYVADELKMDEVDLRLKNLIRPDEMPYKNSYGLTYDTGDYPALLRRAVEVLEYDKLKRWAEEERKRGRKVGVGLAFYLEICAFGPWEYSEVRVDEMGGVTVVTGSTPHGQGTDTAIAQLVADRLQIGIDKIRVIWGDTDQVAAGMGTYGSRSVTVAGSAALRAADMVLEKMMRAASRKLKADVQEVEYREGVFYVKGDPSRRATWEEVARQAYSMPQPGVSASVLHEADVTFPYGVHISVAEVDKFGIPRILEHRAYDDIGLVVNPMLAEGQVQGATVQAAGQVAYERALIDEEGNLKVTFADYYVPTAVEGPRILSHFAEKPHYSSHLTKSKGVGEAGLIVGPAAMIRALEKASGKRLTRTPVTPDDLT